MTATPSLDNELVVANTLRFLAVDQVQQAHSGHPGLPMGMADVASVLWSRFLVFDPGHPDWPDRDRFVLSGGHGSALLYALLHVSGFDLPLDELQRFRQLGSRTPGHPEHGLTPGVETTTGPLGQGLSNAVGMALAERWLAHRFNRPGHSVVDHRTWVFAGDGDLMEGLSHEVAVLAAHWGLGKLCLFFDDNGITIDGPTHLATCEDVLARFTAYGWQVQRVDGHDHEEVARAIASSLAETARPSLIACRTHIGYGSPNRQDTARAHGEPLGVDEVRLAKQKLGWPVDQSFVVPQVARQVLGEAAQRGARRHEAWQQGLIGYRAEHPGEAEVLERALSGELPEGWDHDLPTFKAGDSLATRAASGAILTSLVHNIPTLLGGSADLTPSNNTRARGQVALTRDDMGGRYIHFGVREHGMAGVLNGLALHGGLIPFGGTFLTFSDYMRPSLRLAAMMQQRVVFVFTHDSIGLGEDGPTHQPVEHLMALRSIPGLTVMRPGDARETLVCWRAAVTRQGPTALCLTRQGLPVLDRERYADAEGALRGAYVLSDVENPRVILIGTGSELHLCLAAQDQLLTQGVAARVVSMPCWELFEEQNPAYRETVLPASIRARVAIEAGVTTGWERYTGDSGRILGMASYGASAPAKQLFAHFGLTVEAVILAANQVSQK
ncbi:MAG: transketolase [Pseudomonadota bacterium]